MKTARIALYLAAAGLFTGCAYIPPNEGASRRVSPDYTATGEVENARAFIYGNITLLEFDTPPALLAVRDEKGESVSYERVGRYYRLPRVVDNFTVWLNGRSVTFSAPMTTRIFSAPAIKSPAQVRESDAVKPFDGGVVALLKLSEMQISTLRNLLDLAGKNPNSTGQELFDVNQRLTEAEARMVTHAAASVRVSFPTASTAFKPNAEVVEVLISAGKAADLVNVRGHTDSKIAGRSDANIASGRALAARNFLVHHGINPDKIKVSFEPDGNFAAPNHTKEGRAINRRVELEFVNPRIPEVKSHSFNLAKNTF